MAGRPVDVLAAGRDGAGQHGGDPIRGRLGAYGSVPGQLVHPTAVAGTPLRLKERLSKVYDFERPRPEFRLLSERPKLNGPVRPVNEPPVRLARG